jgi:hypothetical protein
MQEEEVKFPELIELINEYDYSEDDLLEIKNRVMISFKYLEVLSKTLPAFCHNMKAKQQDELVELIYRCPNQFLCLILEDIGENYNEYIAMLYEEVSELRKEKNLANVNIESIKKAMEKMISFMVLNLYQLVASTVTSKQTLLALNEFDRNENVNYDIMNLMMNEKYSSIKSFFEKAKRVDEKSNVQLAKSLIKYSVRNYFFKNEIELHGEGQKLFDYFFGSKNAKKMQMSIAKRKIINKELSEE